MKHIFIVNPAAGKGQAATRIIPQIEAYFQAHPEIPFEIYVTKAKGDGSDFARIFGGSDKLLDIGAQVHAGTRKFDLIDAGAHVAINQCSMGLDAEVCAKQAYFKKLPGVGGEFAYTMSLFYCLFRRLNSEFKIIVDDEKVVEGKMLFALCANSRWYGGGYKGAPKAVPDDGKLDFILVRKTVGRLKLAQSTFRILPAALDVIMPDEQSYTRVIEDICE